MKQIIRINEEQLCRLIKEEVENSLDKNQVANAKDEEMKKVMQRYLDDNNEEDARTLFLYFKENPEAVKDFIDMDTDNADYIQGTGRHKSWSPAWKDFTDDSDYYDFRVNLPIGEMEDFTVFARCPIDISFTAGSAGSYWNPPEPDETNVTADSFKSIYLTCKYFPNEKIQMPTNDVPNIINYMLDCYCEYLEENYDEDTHRSRFDPNY